MILPDIYLSHTSNTVTPHHACDSPELCNDSAWFTQYPWPVEYRFNSRGFRDQEWPSDLQSATWCVGDSATVGVGQPLEHTWVHLLSQRLQQRTINVSLTGASNAWILRKALSILQQVQPRRMVIHWSFFHRRENNILDQSDEDRQLHYDPDMNPDTALKTDVELFQQAVEAVNSAAVYTEVVHSTVPNAFPGMNRKELEGWWYQQRRSHWPEQLPIAWDNVPRGMHRELKSHSLGDTLHWHWAMQDYAQAHDIVLLEQEDENYQRELARDGQHYDLKTATRFVDAVLAVMQRRGRLDSEQASTKGLQE